MNDESEQFIDPYSDPILRQYLLNVLDWHSYIRFLMLPQDNPDVPIDRLYVEPMLSSRPIHPASNPPEREQLNAAINAIQGSQRLIVLGDPGSGKSSLVNWVTFQLSTKSESDWLPILGAGKGRLIPVPVILREIAIGQDITWHKLVEGFLQHQMVSQIAGIGERIEKVLRNGQAFVILDGLDEIGSVDARRALCAAVHEGMNRYKKCRWLLTSRIVGYDAVPFEYREPLLPGAIRTKSKSLSLGIHSLSSFKPGRQKRKGLVGKGSEQIGKDLFTEEQMAVVQYIAPFTDQQIYQFCKNWFHHRDFNKERASDEATRFFERIRSHPTTLRLSRTPNLLTMMALIFRAKAQLPHGKTLLYNEIARAYLDSIDRYRGLKEGAGYPFEQKMRWLARVGYQMQLRRAKRGLKSTADGETQEILVDAEEVERWVADAMEESGYEGQNVANDFVDFVKRRSGLLVPRGADRKGRDRYAFMHLSFQEYFAAYFLEQLLLSPPERPGQAKIYVELKRCARNPLWRETLVFLFELLASRPGWPEALAIKLFGHQFNSVKAGYEASENAAILVAHLSSDPHSGFRRDARKAAIRACCRWESERQKNDDSIWDYKPYVAQALFTSDDEIRKEVWKELVSACEASQNKSLTLEGTSITDITPIAELSQLEQLNLDHTGVHDISPLTNLSGLSSLYLFYTYVTNIEPLAQLSKLRSLFIAGSDVTDISPIAGLINMRMLWLGSLRISDLSALSSLRKLENLYLVNLQLTNISPLSMLTDLDDLSIDHIEIQDAEPIGQLIKIQRLSLRYTSIQNLSPLAGLSKLRSLSLDGSKNISDLDVLRSLGELQWLSLEKTGITDISSLADCHKLMFLDISDCNITSLVPLALSKSLRTIKISNDALDSSHVAELQAIRRKKQLSAVKIVS